VIKFYIVIVYAMNCMVGYVAQW